jgi:sugar fermentation stimulation protein A
MPCALSLRKQSEALLLSKLICMRLTFLRFFRPTRRAFFVSRPNRFTLTCHLDGKEVQAFLPNPGRLLELLIPGAPVYLEPAQNPSRRLSLTAVAVERERHRVVLHTHRANDVARYLIQSGAVHGLQGYEVLRGEVRRGKSRFDFLLKKKDREALVEVKSCTLFSRRAAMFPDAVTLRGKKHLEELARLSDKKTLCAVLFLIQWPQAEFFMPDFHTDLDFARAMMEARGKVLFLPLSVRWRIDLSLAAREARDVPVLWEALTREVQDGGSYLLVLRLRQETGIAVGALGRLRLRPGFYLYVGSAERNLTKRIDRHKRLKKKTFWHIDYLRAASELCAALPVRSTDRLECEIARALHPVTEWVVPGFGSSDCACPSHLFGMRENPLSNPRFHHLLQHFRMERLVDKYATI